MRSLRIGLDVDGSVTDFVSPLISYLDGVGIKVPTYEDTHDFDLKNVWRCTREEAVRRVNLFLNSQEFTFLTPMPGVREAFDLLFPPHVGYPITSRPEGVEHITRDFFDRHLDGNTNLSIT